MGFVLCGELEGWEGKGEWEKGEKGERKLKGKGKAKQKDPPMGSQSPSGWAEPFPAALQPAGCTDLSCSVCSPISAAPSSPSLGHTGRSAAHLAEALVCLRQGTVLRTQTPVLGSVFSTMTKGRSSSVATVRCRLSTTGCRKEP